MGTCVAIVRSPDLDKGSARYSASGAMITYVKGDLFEAPAKVLVNTVNTVGVMGKGIALEFKRLYPEMFSRYQHFCETGQLTVGKLYLFKTDHKWVLNFPTKKHWRTPSRLEYVEAGLKKFVCQYADIGITSIAFPALGCGNGELDYGTQVRPLMEKYLNDIPIPVFIYLQRPTITPQSHRDVKRVSAWLRQDAPSLPFEQVWRDVHNILANGRNLHTIDGQHRFVAHSKSNPMRLQIACSDRSFAYSEDELWTFWQRLRDHGLVHEEILAEYYRPLFLMSVFEVLRYVQRIQVSMSANELWHAPYNGLQMTPDFGAG